MEKKLSIENLTKQILEDSGYVSGAVDIKKLVTDSEIKLEEYPDEQGGISGALIRVRDDFTILYATRIKNEGLHNFSIAHEFGHYSIPNHPEATLKNGKHFSEAGFRSKNIFEREADYFASCLLLPRKQLVIKLKFLQEGIDSILELSKEFRTSITCTAIRYVELASNAVSIIMSKDGVILYSFHSKPMRDIGKISELLKGKAIPKNTLSYSNEIYSETNTREGYLDQWLECCSTIICKEEVLDLGEYGRRLTVITTNHSPDDYEESDQDNDEWAPPSFSRKFRR